MERDPKEKVIVVTGGASGIGFEITDKFLQNEAKTLIILDINEPVGIEAASTLNAKYGNDKAIFIKCDVTKDLDKVSNKIFQKHQVDVLINNAGILDETSIRKTFEVNCIALMEWSMKFWEYMRKDKGGRGGTIYNVASIYSYEYNPWVVYYKSSKRAVLGFTRSLGHPYNYEKSGVRVIAICPGFTDTPILKANVWEYQKDDFNKNMTTHNIIQKPETVGKAAVEIFTVADSGAAWVARDEKPIEMAPITDYV